MAVSEYLRYCGLPIARLNAETYVARMRDAVERGDVFTATYLHFHTVNLVTADSEARNTFQQLDVVAPDGFAVLWSSRLFGRSLVRENIVVMETIMPEFSREAGRGAWTLFLFGGAPGVADQARVRLEDAYPQLRVVGTQHGYLRSDDEMATVVDTIARTKPTVVLVALGQPAQERWIVRYRDRLGAHVIVGVGGFLDKLAKGADIYPRWVRRTKWYWLYRILTERQRVAKRYTLGGARFVKNVLRARFFSRKGVVHCGRAS